MDLNELIDRTHFDYEQNETKAKFEYARTFTK